MGIRVSAKQAKAMGLGTLRGPRVDYIVLVLPYPPTVNNLYATVRGRRIKSKAAKAFCEAVQDECRRGVGHVEGRVKLWIDVYPPDARKRDLDNVLKATIDALVEAGLFADDSQVDEIRIERKWQAFGGKIVVEIAGE